MQNRGFCVGIFVINAILQGCVTAPKVSLTSNDQEFLEALFVKCRPLDGLIRLTSEEYDLVTDAEVEWAAGVDGSVALSWINPLGQSMLSLRTLPGSKKAVVSGPMRAKFSFLNGMTLGDAGEISFEGRNVGFMIGELGCLLSGTLPRPWLKEVFDFTKDSSKISLKIRSRDRRINIDLNRMNPAQHCFVIVWGGILKMFRSKLRVCREPRKGGIFNEAFTEDGRSLLEWTNIDD